MGNPWFNKIFNDTKGLAFERTLTAYRGGIDITFEMILVTYMTHLMTLAKAEIRADNNVGDIQNEVRLDKDYSNYIEAMQGRGFLDDKVNEIKRSIDNGFDFMEVDAERGLHPNGRVRNAGIHLLDVVHAIPVGVPL